MAGDEPHTAGRHCRHLELAGVHRKTRYGPLFAKPIAWGDRGRVDELTKGENERRKDVDSAVVGEWRPDPFLQVRRRLGCLWKR